MINRIEKPASSQTSDGTACDRACGVWRPRTCDSMDPGRLLPRV